jgi:hypothetical protein
MQRQSLPLITFFTLHMVDKHPHPHYNKVMVCEKQTSMTVRIGHGVFFLDTAGAKQHSTLMRKHWSWCFVPQDCCLRNRAQSLWGNIGYGVFFLKTAGEKQSSKFMRTMCCMYSKFIPESR